METDQLLQLLSPDIQEAQQRTTARLQHQGRENATTSKVARIYYQSPDTAGSTTTNAELVITPTDSDPNDMHWLSVTSTIWCMTHFELLSIQSSSSGGRR
ncbi:hypothetical protein SARC_02822 [Sphaeroforma arctica JP610]|uniref:Uncharacterized protein n=1 Tax=Sphaeroforma arctica JP610 TaxID=667725 RepID=A0A0L0G7F1_9EUKA|nr:hypothetical protein SARC_02822 [Sphaeroforma arctica JP610]KNC84967.1 hypothetical protein SARC_02822 [Sphaeroforma arctica JP610]|eukprot:XP_014158869.1 hypothetical protein SARC_02822 [Sphaeroforma arctica JP610]